MFNPDPEFSPSRIPDPKTGTKERGEKNFVLPFFVATKVPLWGEESIPGTESGIE
jgi:hypothetical protein